MGVDYFPCDGCNELICITGDYHSCNHCTQSFCEECSEKLKHIYICNKCRWQKELCNCSEKQTRIPTWLHGRRNIKKLYLCDLCVDGRGPSNKNLIEFLFLKAGFKSRPEAEKAYFTANNEISTRVVVKNQDGPVKFVEVDRYGPEEDDPFPMI